MRIPPSYLTSSTTPEFTPFAAFQIPTRTPTTLSHFSLCILTCHNPLTCLILSFLHSLSISLIYITSSATSLSTTPRFQIPTSIPPPLSPLSICLLSLSQTSHLFISHSLTLSDLFDHAPSTTPIPASQTSRHTSPVALLPVRAS